MRSRVAIRTQVALRVRGRWFLPVVERGWSRLSIARTDARPSSESHLGCGPAMERRRGPPRAPGAFHGPNRHRVPRPGPAARAGQNPVGRSRPLSILQYVGGGAPLRALALPSGGRARRLVHLCGRHGALCPRRARGERQGKGAVVRGTTNRARDRARSAFWASLGACVTAAPQAELYLGNWLRRLDSNQRPTD